jgi:hypothetical protein
MSRGIKIINGISKWVRERVGPEAENRGEDNTDNSDETEAQDDDTNGESSSNDSPVCCSAASNTDLTVLES